MEKLLSGVGSFLYRMRFTMLFFYVGLVAIIFGILGKFLLETYKLMNTLLFGELEKIPLISKVLELVDMTMVTQLVWVVALAGVSLFVTTGHFDKTDMKKPDWLDHVNTYNLKLKLAFAIISISGVHALKTYLSGELTIENIQIVTMWLTTITLAPLTPLILTPLTPLITWHRAQVQTAAKSGTRH